jgi:site-specific DNA recombinase
LINTAYYGDFRYGKKNYVDGKGKGIDTPDAIIIIPVPPIISQETFEIAQRKMIDIRRKWGGLKRNEYLLSGIITCTDCGNTMTGVARNNWGKKGRGYTCRKSGSTSLKLGCHPVKVIEASALEESIWEKIKGLLTDPKQLIAEIKENIPQQNSFFDELGRIEIRQKETEKGRNNLIEAISSGYLELDENTKSKLSELNRRRTALSIRVDEINKSIKSFEMSQVSFNKLRAVSTELISDLDNFDFDQKQSLVRAVTSQVLVSGKARTGPRVNGVTLEGVDISVVLNAEEAVFNIGNILRGTSH